MGNKKRKGEDKSLLLRVYLHDSSVNTTAFSVHDRLNLP